MKEVPVLLLTGYLGSGKTTLLNRILANERGIKFAVIVNDIGEVNIDANLIEAGGVVGKGDDSLVALQNGCICCTLKMDLVKQLQDIISQKRFDYIVIEASGICEPAPIAQTICSMPQMLPPEQLKDGVPRLDSIVSVVDALRLRDEFANGSELTQKDLPDDDLASLVIQQIEFCNQILLNKASEVSAEDLGKIKSILHAIQPKAPITTCDYCDVDLDELVKTRRFNFDEVARSAAWIEAIEGEEMENEETGEAYEYGIDTFVYNRRPAFNLGRFDEYVATKWPKSIIRCKGLCYFRDEMQTCYVFEQAGKQVQIRNAGQWFAEMPKKELEDFLLTHPEVQRDWDEKYGDRMQKLVFIGQNLNREEIEKELDKCLEE